RDIYPCFFLFDARIGAMAEPREPLAIRWLHDPEPPQRFHSLSQDHIRIQQQQCHLLRIFPTDLDEKARLSYWLQVQELSEGEASYEHFLYQMPAALEAFR